MAAEAQKIDELAVPDGGIGDLIMEDDEIEAVYGDDDDGTEEFGDDGIAQFPALTKKMAAMGRGNDTILAHMEAGEVVIPKKIADDHPELVEALFKYMKDEYGVKAPERYIAGHEENSLNPETLAPEFIFKFIKKGLKSLVKGIKNVVKGVVKVVKKIAPIILPIALAMTPLGPIYGAALGSGIGTLIQGGSIKDALKSALIAGVTGGAMKGISNVATGSGTFMEGFSKSLANPMARFGQTVSGAQTTIGNVFGGAEAQAANAGKQTLFSQFDPTAVEGYQPPAEVIPEVSTDAGANVDAATKVNTGAADGTALTPEQIQQQAAELKINTYETPGFVKSIGQAITPGDGVGFGEGMKNAFMPNAGAPTATDFLTAQGTSNALATAAQRAAANEAAGQLGAGLMRTYGPAALLGTAGVAAAGGFTAPPMEEAGVIERDEDGNAITGSDLVDADPSAYMIADLGNRVLDSETGEYISRAEANRRAREAAAGGLASLSSYQPPELATSPAAPAQQTVALDPNAYFLQGSTPGGPFARPFVGQTLADGGQVFPRRNGGIMPDEGVPNQDSVRAMLMPGEFVMTTDAVKGLGNGDMNTGIKNMYSVMRNLENRGRATA